MPFARLLHRTARLLRTVARSLLLTLGLFSGLPADAGQPADPAQSPAMELRAMFLRNSPEELHLSPELANAPVRGVIMDMGFAQGTVSVLGFPTGDASIYLSSGGGFLGGGGHASVANAAKRWTKEIETHTASLQKTDTFPLPADGWVNLYVMTPQGVLTTQASVQALGAKTHPLWSLFYAGQEVITQYRLVEQRKQQAAPN
jgi:hypothetical protein